ncbi:MAG: type VI secretion system Vgr family protein, partial [Gemmataceae bacterium]
QEVCAGSYTLWDHHFELTGKHLEGQANLPEAVAIGKVEHPLRIPASTSLEVFEYPGGYAHHYDGVGPGGGDQAGKLQRVFPESERVVRLRVQEEAARCLTIEGGSECSQLLPGHGFTLQGHFDADDAYLVTRVAHRARAGGVQSGGQSEVEYSNTFACLPARMSYRPARLTPRPLIAGMQTATVTGLEDQPTYLDKYGRVKVQFHWDRQGKMDASSSCWLRVAQLWAGKNWGAFFWPRVGHEVVVIFEEGNPDCPLVVGSVYNDVNVPPVNLPADSAIAGIKSCIFGGDPATRFNSIVFYDAQGAEFIVVHSHLVEMNNSSADKYTHTPSMSLTFQGSFP